MDSSCLTAAPHPLPCPTPAPLVFSAPAAAPLHVLRCQSWQQQPRRPPCPLAAALTLAPHLLPLPYTRSPCLHSAGGGATARVALSELAAAAKASTLPPPDAKATYSEVMATVGTFRTENMWYLAHPETGKKVTQQGVSVGRV